MKAFCGRFFCLIGCLMLISAGLGVRSYALDIPAAIKYQAVLRDMNGSPLSNKANVNLRISLRAGDPVQGNIVYSEDHTGIATNAYGVIHLAIGRGTVVTGTSLQDVPWGEDDLYVQIEVETDGSGYTNMGTAELLTVPYAFMSGNASGDILYEHLQDNFLPKFNAANRTLASSGISQTGRDVIVDAGSVKFLNSAVGTESYTFPAGVGRKGQVMVLSDNTGTLAWGDMTGSGGGTGPDPFAHLRGDGRLLYWNEPRGEVDTAPLVYKYDGDKNFYLDASLVVTDTVRAGGNIEMAGDMVAGGGVFAAGNVVTAGNVQTTNVIIPAAGDMVINTNVTGNHNLLTTDLGDARIWIGNGATPPQARTIDGHIRMDNAGMTELNLELLGSVELRRGATGTRDTLAVTAKTGGDSLWMQNATLDLYAYNKGKTLGQTKVGIGTDAPEAMLHVSDGDVLFTAAPDMTTRNRPRVSWNAAKFAFRAGGLMDASDAWDDNNTGNYSLALGLNAKAAREYGFAIGSLSEALAERSFAIGTQARASGQNSFAIGDQSEVTEEMAMAVGYAAKAQGLQSMAVGWSSEARGDDAVVVGQNSWGGAESVVFGRYNNYNIPLGKGVVVMGSENNISEKNVVVVGKDNENLGENSIVFGNSNTQSGKDAIVIGRGNDNAPTNSVIVGTINNSGSAAGPVVVGHAPSAGSDMIAVGRRLYNGASGPGVILIGSDINNRYDDIVALGNLYNTDDISGYGRVPSAVNSGSDPVLMYGSNKILSTAGSSVAFEIVADGSAHFLGSVHAAGVQLTSDYRLKTDIKPVSWPVVILDSLTPVSFRYKSDRKQRTRLGFVAQEVRKYFPDVVTEGAKGYLSMDYMGMVPVLWQMNRQLFHQLTDMEKRLEEQQRQMSEKDKKIAELESVLKTEIEAIKQKIGM